MMEMMKHPTMELMKHAMMELMKDLMMEMMNGFQNRCDMDPPMILDISEIKFLQFYCI